MKAIEAAEHSDILLEAKTQMIVSKEGDNWFDDSGVVDISELSSDNYVPLVPKKIYKAGDQVTFPEDMWTPNNWNMSYFKNSVCTLVDDLSIPPKPTLESLPAWTRCKVEPVNNDSTWWDVIKKPNGSFMHHYSGNDFEWVNVKLVSIYNPKTEQWEDV